MPATLLEKIKYLVPDAKCAVWNTTDRKNYHGEKGAIQLKDHLIDWQEGNSHPCPTDVMIDSIDENALNIALRDEKRHFLIESYKSNKIIMMCYRTHQLVSKKDVPFDQFLSDNDFI